MHFFKPIISLKIYITLVLTAHNKIIEEQNNWQSL